MKSFYLSEITTEDGLLHHGIFSCPKNHGKRAVLWVHGLSAAFYNDIHLSEAVADACEKKGWGFSLFNNRGHDLIAGIRKYDKTPPNGYSYYPGGAGSEVFEESILDIDAGITFLVKEGFSEVILVGHSTGSNKVCYFAATQNNPHVIGVVLSGPMSDRLGVVNTADQIIKMKQKIAEGNGNELLLGHHFFPITPKRFLSLFEPGSNEDTFDYGDEKPKMTYFSKIKLPLLVLLAGDDEHRDRPIDDIKNVFDAHAKTKSYKSISIPGAVHKFHGKEKKVAAAMIKWMKTI